MVDPYFSVIIPTYNRAAFLPAALDSVLKQKFPSFEIIVVDDGSTDNTEMVVNNYRDERIRYIRQENKERAAARNTGMLYSKAPFVTFLDSDDTILPNHLAVARTFIEVHKPMIFHLGYDVLSPAGEMISKWTPLPSPANKKLLDGNYLSCMGVFISRDVFSRFRFNEDRDLSGSEDYEYWLRLAGHFDILTSPEVTAALINHEQRSVIQTDASRLIRRIELLKQYLKEDDAFVRKYRDSFDRWEAYLDIYVALHLSLMKGRASQSLYYLWQSLIKFPRVILSRRFWVIPKKLIMG